MLDNIFTLKHPLHSWYLFLVTGDPMCQVEAFITSLRLPADTIVCQEPNATNTTRKEYATVQALGDDQAFILSVFYSLRHSSSA